jgi:hypothetical protein
MSNQRNKAKRHKLGVDRRRLLHSSYVWHRRIGLSVCVLVLWLAITGLVLNHNDDLELGHHNIPASWASSIYGVEADIPRAWAVADKWLFASDDLIFFANQQTSISSQLTGATSLNGLVIATSGTEVFLFTDSGELIERLDSGFAPPIFALGLFDQQIVINTSSGPVASSVEFAGWEKLPHNSPVEWSQTAEPPSKQLAGLPASNGISWERFLLDIHAGRILGSARIIIADIAALGMILLALSGFYTWFTRYRRKQH